MAWLADNSLSIGWTPIVVATGLGRITIGRGSSIGGNMRLTQDAAPESVTTQAKARNESFDDRGGIRP